MTGLKSILVAFSFLALQHSVFAQDISKHNFKIGVTGGIGQYIQSDLKDMNRMVKNRLSFETSLVNDFPLSVFWGFHLLYKLKPAIYAGPGYQFHTTGSRLGASDYSGSYTFDQILSCHSVYFQLEGTVYKMNEVAFSINFSGGVQISKWNTTEKLVLQDQSLSLFENFKGLRPFIYPSFKVSYPLTEFLSLSTSAGYSIDIGGKYKNVDQTNSEMIAQWNGLRIEFNICYSF